MSHFSDVPLAPPDPIFGVAQAFKEDSRSDKVNLGVGIFHSSDLTVPLLGCVKKAEKAITASDRPRPYLPIDGDGKFVAATKELLFGGDDTDAIIGLQAVGATGALFSIGRFLKSVLGKEAIYLPNPTWANHKAVYKQLGLKLEAYDYYDNRANQLSANLLSSLEAIPEGSPVLFHTCCHNPTGIDPDLETWEKIAKICSDRNLLAIFDTAYQGFGHGLEEDAASVRLFARLGIEFFATYSFAKNLSLYGERVGALFLHSPSGTDKGLSQLKVLIRSCYSNPPAHGGWIVSEVLSTPELRAEWVSELNSMRERVQEMRLALMSGLLAKGGERDFHFMEKQHGLFSFCGLEQDHVERLGAEYGIYMPKSGRINVTGLNTTNIGYVVDAIIAVLS